MNGWQKAWFVVSAIWFIGCVLLGLFGGVAGFFAGAVVGLAIPALLYVLGLALKWLQGK